ncbi:ABC transporter substrate-binding protein [Micromonospora sp. SD19]|uniref:ABC transporter substrate-binding protein n=1 Tax=Micromonospora parva TaxID=1464048 RepID=A0ABW6VLU5_9ACTN|nr:MULTISPECIES: ABC transporter substrate-binding protein [Micromonospora]MBQ1030409.1 carbohydrate ABC transporter substrate-binding protein [Micromonospora sp. C97]
MLRHLTGAYALAVLLVAAAGCSEQEPDGSAKTGPPETVTILGATSDHKKYMQRHFDQWAKTSGIHVTYVTSSDFENEAPERLRSADPPDLLLLPQPALLSQFAEKGDVKDLEKMGLFDRDELGRRMRPGLIDNGVVGGTLAGVPLSLNLKGLVWYPPQAFRKAAYQAPATWEQMLALTARIREEQKAAPWCIGIADGGATGWMTTDWIEDLVLRTAGPEVYDRWVAGELPFTAPEIKRAFTMFEQVALADGNALGGRGHIVSTTFPEALKPMFQSPPGCWLNKQSSFIVGSFPEGTKAGSDYDVFPFPAPAGSDAADGSRAVIGGDILALVQDRPAVRETARLMTTADWFRQSRAHEGGTLSAFTDVSPGDYAHPVDATHAQILNRVRTFRFDGSDSMPPAVGAGSFWRETTAWIAGRQDLDTTLRAIDASWPR